MPPFFPTTTRAPPWRVVRSLQNTRGIWYGEITLYPLGFEHDWTTNAAGESFTWPLYRAVFLGSNQPAFQWGAMECLEWKLVGLVHPGFADRRVPAHEHF